MSEFEEKADFDPHFTIYHELMAFKVMNILLVSSPYDAFIMEEDGSIAAQVVKEYQGLNLSGAPWVTRVSSGAEALERIRDEAFDLVITMPYMSGMNAFDLGLAVKKIKPGLPVILLAHTIRAVSPLSAKCDASGIDNIFLWCCGADLLVALVKNVEDHVNVVADTRRAMVRVIIYIEDSPVDRSFFLPLIYTEVVRQTQAVLDESLNEKHRLLRMRARPKVLMAADYEQALALYEAYKPNVFGIISDARFSRDCRMDREAGLRFLSHVREEIHDLPLLLLSSEPSNQARAEAIPAVYINKSSPLVREELHRFFMDHLGFGDFVFRMPDQTEICRARSIGEFEERLKVIPAASLRYHADRNHFSNWIMARAEIALSRRLHREYITRIEKVEDMRADLVFKVHALRKLRQQGVVARFAAGRYDPEIMDFVKIGDGSVGGKARGLAFMWARLQNVHDSILAQLRVTIPKTCVISADGFDSFVRENHLHLTEGLDDRAIEDLFLRAKMPRWLSANLRIYLDHCRFPLSVRSSSLLEDGLFKPFAGLYSTYFLANNHRDPGERLRQLEDAVKLVYASTWFEGPQAFARNSAEGHDDSMAIIIQQVAGERYGDHWYPAVSGVAQSHNYYPVLKMRAEEGIAHIAIGIGKTVVEGGKSLRFSPAHPASLVQFSTVDDILFNCQRKFYALDVSGAASFTRENSNLAQRAVQEAEKEFPVQTLCSTFIADEHRIRDTFLPGLKVMTFARLLKYNLYPLPAILTEILRVGAEGMGCEVEIEFAVNLTKNPAESVFYLLQLRPMVRGGEQEDVRIDAQEKSQAFCYATTCLGHGRFTGMSDIVFVKPESFDPAVTKNIASEVGAVNRGLAGARRPYLLIGPGRWGSADPWLGIPVQWGDISGVGAIIEVCSEGIRADPSQGSHFFQNITSLGIPYLTVNPQRVDDLPADSREEGHDRLDWQWLLSQEPEYDGRYIRHVRFSLPFVMICNSKTSESVLYAQPFGQMLSSSPVKEK
ncbi:MAG: PEP/pyruvate-binding domain-containing protein [Desulfocapsaceae bacterium]|nr:PEP/pyruvate-binding domain-containing protein [Desulfocapsaceae bacterium]